MCPESALPRIQFSHLKSGLFSHTLVVANFRGFLQFYFSLQVSDFQIFASKFFLLLQRHWAPLFAAFMF